MGGMSTSSSVGISNQISKETKSLGEVGVSDERRAVLEEVVRRQSLHREILYKVLVYCQEWRMLSVIEKAIASYPEFGQATQSPYHFISVLAKAGGLDRRYRDAEGAPIDPGLWEGMGEDERDDLIADEEYRTTDIGRAFVVQHAPHARLVELMQNEPQRAASYRDLLVFCANEPRTYRDVESLLCGRDVLVRDVDGHREPMQPSVLVDRLQRAAGLVWEKGWRTTEEGKEFLQDE